MSISNKLPCPFRGIGTALITPMRDGKPDHAAMRHLVEQQIAGGVSALIVMGTTGEAVTLRRSERAAVLATVQEAAGGRVPIIVGTGAPDTRDAITNAGYARAHGADGILVVTPYYNKGTAEGIVEHYLAIAEAAKLPTILYNVPSRTGVNLSLSQLCRLAEHPCIVAIKEASGDIGRVADIVATLGDRLMVYSGNDGELLPTLALGGIGLISVISNLYPAKMTAIYRLFCEKRIDEAAKAAAALLPLIRLLFAETNPSPIKYAMSLSGICTNELRLPLTPPSPALCEKLKAEVEKTQSL